MASGPSTRTVLAGLAAALALAAPSAASARPRPWYAPDHAKLQLAGNVGFLSPGVGYALGRRLEGDVFLGWVPEAIGGTDVFSVTGKLTLSPGTVEAGGWRVRPFSAGLQVTYTFGGQYFVVPPFTFTPTALRAGLALGSAASVPVRGRRLGVYAEVVALDLGLVYWLSNRDALSPLDVFSLAFGVRLEL
jgi:hypothetical protein